MHVFVFDIETVPDVDGGRRLYQLENMEDADVAQAMFALRREKTGHTFLPHHLQKIVAISVLLRTADTLKVWSLGDANANEAEIITRFFAGIEKFTPTIVSWNGSGFDLPVLHYRTLLHHISAPRYWEVGDDDQSFRWNNYINRYHYRHLDLMDVLAGYQGRATAPLDEMASLLGYPGKMGMSGAKVWDHYQAGDREGIRNYCETDVLNTYLVYLSFELMRGQLSKENYQQECETVRNYLKTSDAGHFHEFLSHWETVSI